jgi:hypothetical protein
MGLNPAHACADVLLYRFNLRVTECRLAAMLLAHLLSAADPQQHEGLDWHNVSILQQVEPHVQQYAALQCSGSNVTTTNSSSSSGNGEALAAAVRQLLPQKTYTLDQVRAPHPCVFM